MSTTLPAVLDFHLPDELVARDPPEARGLARDAVRLMVSQRADDTISHTRFTNLPDFLESGDILVVNASATMNAAFEAVRRTAVGGSERVLLHLSTELAADIWVVELRRVTSDGNVPLRGVGPGDIVLLPAGGTASIIAPFGDSQRLSVARLSVPDGVQAYAARHGMPIRYDYVKEPWPLAYYQTIFSADRGSVEMPSASRPFTAEVVRSLRHRGVQVADIVLHTGVSSLDADEPPYPERYRVAADTADAVNRTRDAGGRVVAVGTTVVRALEAAASNDGTIDPASGWTDLVITPERGLQAVDALLTGFHSPSASHLGMLEALAGRGHLARAYEQALDQRYLWHEFGDVHLII